MDFFERQDKARHKTKWLVFYFVIAVVLIIAAVYLAALLVFSGAKARQHSGEEVQIALWNTQLFFGVAVATISIIVGGSAYKTAQLAAGGSVVATSLGGRPVSSNTTDPNERKLLNIVEEMSIASGVPMPQVYVMDGESGINAFAAGHTTSDAVVSVTRGCLQSLNRDELQGVIGHEFSHILNGDMRLNLRLMGIIFGILCLAIIGRILLRTRGRKNPLPIFGLALLLVGYIGVFFGQLIQAAVSRQREFLADASSVQFTRNPEGLSGALQKIGSAGSQLESEHAHEASHMFFGNALGRSFFTAFATHPPLEERIRAIDPAWDGKFKVIPALVEEELARLKKPAARPRTPFPFPFPPVPGTPAAAGFSVTLGFNTSSTIWQKPPPVQPQTVLPNIGKPTSLHLRYAEQLRESFPDPVKTAAREPLTATALIYALLLSADEPLRTKQLQGLASRVDSTIYEKLAALKAGVADLAGHARLPLVNLALPALRQLRPDEFRQFSQTLQWLIESDEQVELFEFALQKIIHRHLEPQFSQTRRAVVQFYSVKPLLPDCSVLLSALARVGSGDETEIARAFQRGAPYLRSPEGEAVLRSQNECGLDLVDAALNRLVQAVPQIKKNVIEACANVVAADGVIQEYEAELLRAFADSLDCPIPPFVDDSVRAAA